MKSLSHGPVAAKSVPSAIYEELLKLIVERQLLPGDRLPPERDLALSFQVSRTTLRAALMSLANIGVLDARQGAGWYVKLDTAPLVENMALHFRLADMALMQVIEARRSLETEVCAFAAQRRTTDDIMALRGILDRMKQTSDPDLYVGLDMELHLKICACSHNPFFSLTLKPIFELMAEHRRGVQNRSGKRGSLKEHIALVEALEQGDVDAARRAMAEHLDGFKVRSSRYLERTSKTGSRPPTVDAV